MVELGVGRPVPARAVFAAAVVLQLVVLYWPRAVDPGRPGVDKVVHATIFGLVLVTGAAARLPVLPLAGVLLAHAVASELIQHFVIPDRDGDPLDSLADAAGVLLGMLVVSAIGRGRVPDPADGDAPARG